MCREDTATCLFYSENDSSWRWFFEQLRDAFGHQRLREGKYTPGQIDQQWTDEIKKDFLQWLNTQKNLPMTREELDGYMKERNW